MQTSDLIAAIAAGVSCISLYVSWATYRASRKDSSSAQARSLDEAEMELREVWQGVFRIGQLKPITPHVIKALDALAVTARRWNEDGPQRALIVSHHMGDYIEVYESIKACKEFAPGTEEKVKETVTPDMRRAYIGMSLHGKKSWT